MDVKVFKINSGEHLICSVLSETDSTYEVEYLCNIFPDPSGQNQFKVLPTYNTFSGTIALNRNNVVYSGKAQEELESQFISAFSGVLVPSSQILHG